MLGHPEVRGEDGNEEKDDSPGGGTPRGWDEKADAAGDFCYPAYKNELAVGGEIVGQFAGLGPSQSSWSTWSG